MIIFGLDGVICHLDKYHYLAWKEIADELEISFSEEQGRDLLGLSRMDSLNVILEAYPGELSKTEKMILAEQKNENFQRLIQELSPGDCAPEVKEMLTRLKRDGYLLAVASASRNASEILMRLALFSLFDYVADGNIGKSSKTGTRMYEYLFKLSGLTPGECVAVEASALGRKAGKTAGIPTVADFKELANLVDCSVDGGTA